MTMYRIDNNKMFNSFKHVHKALNLKRATRKQNFKEFVSTNFDPLTTCNIHNMSSYMLSYHVKLILNKGLNFVYYNQHNHTKE